MLRPLWEKFFRWNATVGLILIFLFGIPRFVIVLNANKTGDYRFVSIIFLLMWLAPFLLLRKEGRRSIGLTRPTHTSRLMLSFLSGALACGVMFLVAEILFGTTINNWFLYISRSYSAMDIIKNAAGTEKLLYFLSYTMVGMTFSPVGEELLYRGLIQGSFAAQWGERRGSMIDSLAFALTHLAHFGIVYVAGSWTLLFVPALLWVVFMFATSLLFFFWKKQTGSLLGAITCHAGFNAAMTYFIFYHILA